MNGKLYRQIGRRIRELRRLANLTQEELAEKAGLSVQYIGFIERGQAKATLDSLVKIARGLGARIEDVFRFPKSDERSAHEELQQLVRVLRNRRPEEIRLFRDHIERSVTVLLSGKP